MGLVILTVIGFICMLILGWNPIASFFGFIGYIMGFVGLVFRWLIIIAIIIFVVKIIIAIIVAIFSSFMD